LLVPGYLIINPCLSTSGADDVYEVTSIAIGCSSNFIATEGKSLHAGGFCWGFQISPSCIQRHILPDAHNSIVNGGKIPVTSPGILNSGFKLICGYWLAGEFGDDNGAGLKLHEVMIGSTNNSNATEVFNISAHESLTCRRSPKHMRWITAGEMVLALSRVSKVATYSAR
jgi:hypothetical protein